MNSRDVRYARQSSFQKRPTKLYLENGDVILFSGGIAIVRFCGRVSFAKGEWVGLELSGPMGDCDGTRKGVRYYKCDPNHGKFIKIRDVKRKIPPEELLLKLHVELEKNDPKGKFSTRKKKELERQLTALVSKIKRMKSKSTDLEKELKMITQKNETLEVQLSSSRNGGAPYYTVKNQTLENGFHSCFGFAHDLLNDLRRVEESGAIRDNTISERIDDNVHLMLMELTQAHTFLEDMGLVTRVEPGSVANADSELYDSKLETRPNIKNLFQ